MENLNVYIAESDDLIVNVLEHLLIEGFEEHHINVGNDKCIFSLQRGTPLLPGPKLLVISEEIYPQKELPKLIESSFDKSQDFLIYLGNREGLENIIIENDGRLWIVPNPIDATKFITILDEIFLQNSKIESKDYHKVSFEFLPNLGESLETELFIKIGDSKFLNILHSGATIDQKFLDQYHEKASNNLYIKRSDAKDFYCRKITKALNQTGSIILKGNPEDLDMSDLSKELGVSKDTVELVDKITGTILTDLKNNRTLKELLSQIGDEEKFSNNLSQLTSYIVVQIASKSKYGNQNFFKKLVFSAIFCDLLLSDQKLVMIKDMKDPNIGVLSTSSRRDLLSHGTLSAEAISNAMNFTTDEITIIEQHHERPNGKGFPKGLSATQISKNAALFITAQEIAYYVLKDYKKGSLSIKQYFEEMVFNNFQTGHFSEFFKLLAEITGFED